MKKVRFESPNKRILNRMDESECQSPRPFLERREITDIPEVGTPQRVVYTNDPVHRFDCSNSSPYPLAKKSIILPVDSIGSNWAPSNDLNLSMLDCHEPRPSYKSYFTPIDLPESNDRPCTQTNVLKSIENNFPPNVLSKDDSFFIRRDNLNNYFKPLDKQLNELNLGKENDSSHKKVEMLSNSHPTGLAMTTINQISKKSIQPSLPVQMKPNDMDCSCHHCNKVQNSTPHSRIPYMSTETPCVNLVSPKHITCNCNCQVKTPNCFYCDQLQNQPKTNCNCNTVNNQLSPKDAVNKKTWAIEKYEQSKKGECMELETQMTVAKEKREPTIGDLLKIIKLQNEQLQLLQEKVDKFISVSNSQPQIQSVPVQNYLSEQVALQTIDSEHKISIGVMTSFEMVRTSTVINKEIVKQTVENAQIQCNRSQISIKEMVSKPHTQNFNFLDGITPIPKVGNQRTENKNESPHENDIVANVGSMPQGNNNEEKTLNEVSLYNVQVDNATTPLMSPDQSLYLDVRDYSGSDSSDDHSNVGWTYYNKVMTHVNGMLQDSDMPSSASALYRNTRQQCVQMQIDKTNVSVTKRVKFGDDPLGLRQPHLYAATDTSLKMNQLAAKYLKSAPAPQRVVKPTTTPIDMSFATRNYMERHKLLQGTTSSRSPPAGEIPRFLDITALKQQPKFL